MVLKLRCPSRTWMVRRSVPDSSRWVAKLCRKVCTVTCLLRPEAARARWQTIWTVRGLTGRSGWRPGKRYGLGRQVAQYSRRTARSRGESITSRSLCPLPWRTWMTMRALSMSSTRSRATSESRSPAA